MRRSAVLEQIEQRRQRQLQPTKSALKVLPLFVKRPGISMREVQSKTGLKLAAVYDARGWLVIHGWLTEDLRPTHKAFELVRERSGALS